MAAAVGPGQRPDLEPSNPERPVEVIPEEPVVAGVHKEAVGGTTPARWWRYSLIGLAVVLLILFLMQVFSGAPGTDMQPGTPTSEPVVEPAVDP